MPRTIPQYLTLAIVGLTLGCGSDTGPTAPRVDESERSLTSANKKGGSGGGKPFPATYSVTVNIGGVVGSAASAVANSADAGFQEVGMMLDLSSVATPASSNCDAFATFADANTSISGSFAAGASKSPRNAPEYTFVWANLFDFSVNGITHSLVLGPNDGTEIATIDDPTDWLPQGNSINSMRGDTITFQVNKGREKKNGCAGVVDQEWEVVVTRNPE